MIISASRRTDIPTFFSAWFENRVKEGYLMVRNPMNIHQVSRVSLDPSVVDGIVFWTKNPQPMLARVRSGVFDAYPYYFQYTLTGYGKDVEGHLPDKKQVLIPAFKELAHIIGPHRVIWRYDPIVFSPKYTPEYHLRAFEAIASELEGCTQQCVISFVDRYRRNATALDELGSSSIEGAELLAFVKRLVEIAGGRGMKVVSCAEAVELSSVGVEHGCCIDAAMIEQLAREHALVDADGAGSLGEFKVGKDKNQRQECGCVSSIDVGEYNTCNNGCRYCYANYSASALRRNLQAHDPESPLLVGTLGPDDKVTDRKMKSLFAAAPTQESLFNIATS